MTDAITAIQSIIARLHALRDRVAANVDRASVGEITAALTQIEADLVALSIRGAGDGDYHERAPLDLDQLSLPLPSID